MYFTGDGVEEDDDEAAVGVQGSRPDPNGCRASPSAATITPSIFDLKSQKEMRCTNSSAVEPTLALQSPIWSFHHPLPKAESGTRASWNTTASSSSLPTSAHRVVPATTTAIVGKDRVFGGTTRTALTSAGRVFNGCFNPGERCMCSGEERTVLRLSTRVGQPPGRSKTPPQLRFYGRSISRIDLGAPRRRDLPIPTTCPGQRPCR